MVRRTATSARPPRPGVGERALTVRDLCPGGGVRDPVRVDDLVADVEALWNGTHGATVAAWYDRYVMAD